MGFVEKMRKNGLNEVALIAVLIVCTRRGFHPLKQSLKYG